MMGKTFMCRHCKKPMTTTPKLIAVGNGFHPECFNELYELQREKDRERKTKLRLRGEAAERRAKALARPRKTVEDVWAEKLAGRRFEDAVHVPQERLLVRGPAF